MSNAHPPSTPPQASPLRDLALDVGVPVGLYFGLHSGLGVGLVDSLALSSVPPALSSIVSWRRAGEINALALLMLAVNLAGIATSFITGDARLTLAKNSAISSVIAVSMLVSVFRGEPLMSAGLRAFWAKDGPRAAAWERLSAGSARFATLERRYTLVWSACLFADCVARLVGALTLPVSTMAWASSAIIVAAIVLGIVVSGIVASGQMLRMLNAEADDSPGPPLAAAAA